eukprot:TRINITY_DN6663_c0_g1_i1.p1 TRINITY_DN6663_c0_g1~~TRINITY_DN6663_c0_g1_i1.p1  ORF type:complete len:909 (+),score=122.76 TRINITY_DN6663_c0_g1_i1:56-2728(+)
MHPHRTTLCSTVVAVVAVVLCVSLWSSLPTVEGCGVSTHNVIARRASDWFSAYPTYYKIIMDHPDAFQNGAAFPDFGYGCPLKSDGYPNLPAMSEAAHWPPFHKRFAQYIHANMSLSSENGQKAMAFLLGMVAHGVADNVWHDLTVTGAETQQGFLQALAETDFFIRDGSYSGDAHTRGDTGGEFIMAYEGELGFMRPLQWYLPTSILSQLFVDAGFTLYPDWVIQACNLELVAEVIAIQDLVGKIGFPNFASGSPFMIDSLQDYWLGGINDMAAHVSECWPYTIGWVETSDITHDCYMSGGPTISSTTPFSQTRLERKQVLYSTLKQQLKAQLEQVKIESKTSLDGVVVTAASKEIADSVVSIDSENVVVSKRIGPCVSEHGNSTATSVTLIVDRAYSYLGLSVASGDFDKDGKADLLTGAPGTPDDLKARGLLGKAFVYYGRQAATVPQGQHTIVDLNKQGVSIEPPVAETDAFSRFGSGVAVLDFNADGYDDAVVSAPGGLGKTLQYTGKVFVYLGGPAGTNFTKPDLTISVSSSDNYTNVGYALHACDVTGDGLADLIVGSPYARGSSDTNNWNRWWYQTGAVSVFVSSNQRKAGSVLDWKQDANWFEYGPHNLYAWFGGALSCAHNASARTTTLFVSASEAADQPNKLCAVGMLYAYDFKWPTNSTSNSTVRLASTLAFTLEGQSEFDKLGLSVALGSPLTQRTADGPTHIAVGMPTKAVPLPPTARIDQAGQVAVIPLAALRALGVGTRYSQSMGGVTAVFQGEQDFARFGWTVNFADVNGDGFDDLWISHPNRNDAVARDAGAGYIFMGGPSRFPIMNTTITNCWVNADFCMEATREYSLYSQRAVFVDVNGDKKLDLLTAGPRDNTIAHHAGSITILFGSLM